MNGPVFLIGFMGVGKTTLGKRLAKLLNIPFVDSDEDIENQFDMSISDYFAKFGEASFRAKERNWLEKLPLEPVVIATGGGMPCFGDHLALMKTKGTVIYLQRPAKELMVRLMEAKKKRPLIAELTNDELLHFINQKLLERERFYTQANIIVGREAQTAEQLVEIIQTYEKHRNDLLKK